MNKVAQIFKEISAMWRYLDEHPELAAIARWRQALEMVLLYLLRRIGPGYYVSGAWWRTDISFSDKWNHMNRGEYRRFIARHNPAAYQKISQHKLVEKAVLTLQGVPTPRFIGYVEAGSGRGAGGQAIGSVGDLEILLRGQLGKRVCFKPAEGYGGAGFAAYDIRLNQDGALTLHHPVRDEFISLQSWWDGMQGSSDGYLLEEYLEQHPQMAALNKDSVNTLRVWVYRGRGGYRVPGALIRVGRRGSQVDNTSSGGVRCVIDADSGRTKLVRLEQHSEHMIDNHPDSGMPLHGVQIPYWNDCKELSKLALSVFPHMKIAGLDIAITPEGPKIIELNVWPDYIGCASMDIVLKRVDRELRQT